MATPLALHEGPKPDTITNPSLSPPGPTSTSGHSVTGTRCPHDLRRLSPTAAPTPAPRILVPEKARRLRSHRQQCAPPTPEAPPALSPRPQNPHRSRPTKQPLFLPAVSSLRGFRTPAPVLAQPSAKGRRPKPFSEAAADRDRRRRSWANPAARDDSAEGRPAPRSASSPCAVAMMTGSRPRSLAPEAAGRFRPALCAQQAWSVSRYLPC